MNQAVQQSFDRIMNGVVAGTSDQTSTFVDMANHEGCVFQVLLGALTTGGTLAVTVLESDSSDGSSPLTLTGSSKSYDVDADDNKLLVIDVHKPAGGRYLGIKIDRGTANAVIDGATAARYAPRKIPTTDGSTVLDKITLISPAAA